MKVRNLGIATHGVCMKENLLQIEGSTREVSKKDTQKLNLMISQFMEYTWQGSWMELLI